MALAETSRLPKRVPSEVIAHELILVHACFAADAEFSGILEFPLRVFWPLSSSELKFSFPQTVQVGFLQLDDYLRRRLHSIRK